MPKPKNLTQKKVVKVEVDKGRLRISLPVAVSQQYYGVLQKRVSLGFADTPENRKIASAKAASIQSDITFERFDFTLVKYGKKLFNIVIKEWYLYSQIFPYLQVIQQVV